MPVSPARSAAYHVLRRVDAGRGFAVDLLQGDVMSRMKDADRRLATEIVMGVLRWRGELNFQIERASGRGIGSLDPEVISILQMGVYQIRFLERIPKPAVVNDAVELTKAAHKRSAAGLVNAVLRKVQRPRQQPGSIAFEEWNEEGREAIKRALPAWLLERWTARSWLQGARSGSETSLRLAWESTRVPPTTLCVASADAAHQAALLDELAREGVVCSPGEWGRSAWTVKSGNVSASRAFREGEVAIQDEGSQLVAELVAPGPGQRVLDLCAAPGMKSALLAQSMGHGHLVVCDVSASRLRTLAKLLPSRIPSGVHLHTTRLDATRSLPFGVRFDRILLDAPCSGTGTLARNPEIKWRLAPRDLVRLAEAQKDMLRNALPLLAEGGRLVYATCSLEPEENEAVVEAVLSQNAGFRRLTGLSKDFPKLSALFDSQGYFRTRPDLHHMDGFFAAVLVRDA